MNAATLHSQIKKAVSYFMILTGLGIVGIWTMDIAGGTFAEQGGFFQWRNEGGDFLWTHIFAEYLTGFSLLTAGLGLLCRKKRAFHLSFIALGALIYTSLNSLGWTLAEPGRMAYGLPMLIGLAGGVASLFVLLSSPGKD